MYPMVSTTAIAYARNFELHQSLRALPRLTPVAAFHEVLAEQISLVDAQLSLPGLLAAVAGNAPSLMSVGPSINFLQLQLLLVGTLLDQTGRAFSSPDDSLRRVPTGLPGAGRITQHFRPGHNGIDIAMPVGTPIEAKQSGQVVYSGWNDEGYGNLVIVENEAYRTYYAHLNSIPVQKGDFVNAGTIVGFSGNTGNSTGPHLHYEVRYNGTPVPPLGVITSPDALGNSI